MLASITEKTISYKALLLMHFIVLVALVLVTPTNIGMAYSAGFMTTWLHFNIKADTNNKGLMFAMVISLSAMFFLSSETNVTSSLSFFLTVGLTFISSWITYYVCSCMQLQTVKKSVSSNKTGH